MKEGGENLLLGKACGGKSKTPPSQELSPSDEERMDNKRMVLAMETDHILVKEITGDDLLLLDHMFDIFNLISNPGGFFKVELFRFLSHLLLQTFDQVFVLSFKKHPHLMDQFPVLLLIDLSAAWAGATLHLIIDAGPQPIRKFGVEASTNRKEAPYQPKRLLKGGGRWIRAEVKRTIFLDPPHNPERGKILLHRKLETRVILIVPQLHVVTGMACLDEVIFEYEGLLFCVGDDGIDVRNLFQHGKSLHIHPFPLLEIGAYPMFDVPRLPDIENRPFFVFKQIDTRVRREMVNFLI
jgi:hypothetical protein